MKSSLLLRHKLTFLVRLTWMASEIGDKRPYSCCFVGFFPQDLLEDATLHFYAFSIKLFIYLFCFGSIRCTYMDTYWFEEKDRYLYVHTYIHT